MAWLTPRRRFLMTIPLALILPSGILTYLGLKMVGLLEIQYKDPINSYITETMSKIRNDTNDKIEKLISTRFSPNVQIQLDQLFPGHEDLTNCRFSLNDPLEFVDSIFVMNSEFELFFFKRVEKESNSSTLWSYSDDVLLTFSGLLDGKIKDEYSRSTDNNYTLYAYPSSSLYTIEREIAAFKILDSEQSFNSSTDGPVQNRFTAVGFTFQFEYIQTVFFNEIVNDAWNKDELRYPVMIHDMATNTRVAEPLMIGAMQLNVSEDIDPKLFSKDFYWYRLQYSSVTGKDVQAIIETNRFIYYCLIASANIIMIVAIIGSIRNINQELLLSDMRSDFVARVSHELRTPLGLIRLYSETLEMDRAKDPAKQKEYLHAITKESERLTHLISNVLNFSQIEAQRKHYKLVNTPIDEVIEESLDSISYHLERKGFEIKMDIEDNLPQVMCDRDAMQLALYNLLSNAVKYSNENKYIEITVSRDNKNIILAVKDQGIGISKDDQKKIFQEFYRVDDPVVRATGGSGLGLAVTKHIIEGHKGTLSVESQPGLGSIFNIHLPINNT